jgi:hypothetical protein
VWERVGGPTGGNLIEERSLGQGGARAGNEVVVGQGTAGKGGKYEPKSIFAGMHPARFRKAQCLSG